MTRTIISQARARDILARHAAGTGKLTELLNDRERDAFHRLLMHSGPCVSHHSIICEIAALPAAIDPRQETFTPAPRLREKLQALAEKPLAGGTRDLPADSLFGDAHRQMSLF